MKSTGLNSLIAFLLLLSTSLSPAMSSIADESTKMTTLTFADHTNNVAHDGYNRSTLPHMIERDSIVNQSILFSNYDYDAITYNDSLNKESMTGPFSKYGYPFQIFEFKTDVTKILWLNVSWIGHGFCFSRPPPLTGGIEIYILNGTKWEALSNYTSEFRLENVVLQKSYSFPDYYVRSGYVAILVWNYYGTGNSSSHIFTDYIEVAIGYQDQNTSNEGTMRWEYVVIPVAVIITVMVLYCLYENGRKKRNSVKR